MGRVLGESDVVLDESVDELVGRVELAKTESGSFVGLPREESQLCQLIGRRERAREENGGEKGGDRRRQEWKCKLTLVPRSNGTLTNLPSASCCDDNMGSKLPSTTGLQ